MLHSPYFSNQACSRKQSPDHRCSDVPEFRANIWRSGRGVPHAMARSLQRSGCRVDRRQLKSKREGAFWGLLFQVWVEVVLSMSFSKEISGVLEGMEMECVRWGDECMQQGITDLPKSISRSSGKYTHGWKGYYAKQNSRSCLLCMYSITWP